MHFFVFLLSLTIISGQQSFLSLADGLYDRNRETIFLKIFTAKCGNFHFEFCAFSFFLHDLITNKARKLKVAESNLIMKTIPSSLSLSLSSLSFSLSLSLCVCVCLLVGVFSLLFLVLSCTLSLSPLNYFVDAAFQRLLCGVTSSSITLTTPFQSRPFNQAKNSPTKQCIGTDEAKRSPVVRGHFARRYIF